MKKIILACIVFLSFFLFSQPVFAQTIVPKEQTGLWNGIIGVVSAIATLNNPVHFDNPKKEFSLAQQPSFTLSIPAHVKDKIGQASDNVWKTQEENITAAIVTREGKSFPVTIKKTSEGTFLLVASTSLPRGNFTLKVAAEETSFYTRDLSQDFSWGVIAVNTNKSIFSSHETAHLYFGIVDNKGNTVCNADITAVIGDPHGNTTTLSTQNGTIKHNPQCSGSSVVYGGDYSAEYQTGDEGQYGMHVIATTKAGSHSLDDYFLVKNNQPFIVERSKAPTRMYPAAAYDMVLKITANQDYQGIVEDMVPKAFKITDISSKGTVPNAPNYPLTTPSPDVIKQDNETYARLPKRSDLLYEDLSQVTIDHTPMLIIWQVKWKKGHTYTLSYTLNYPPVSPEFLLIGPFQIGNTTNKQEPIFQEARQWQITSDATQCWAGAAGGNWSTSTNWVTTTGAAGAVPGSGDVATFDPAGSTCTSGATNNNSTIDSSFGGSVAGILITSNYTATITQNKAMTVGTSNYSQANGTYSGGSTAFTNNGTFSLTGGTFTATTATFKQVGNFTYSGGTFTGSGNLTLAPSGNGTETFTGSVTVATFTASETTACNFPTISIDSATTITSTGLVTLTHSTGCTTDSKINGGNITAQANLTVSGEGWEGSTVITMTTANPSITGVSSGDGFAPGITFNDSGTITLTNRIVISGNLTYQAGTFSGGTWWVSPVGASGSMTISGTFTLPNLEFFQYNGTWTPTFTISSGSTVTVSGTTTFASKTGGGTGTINGSGTLAIQGTATSTTNTGFKGASTLTIAFTGSASQTITASGTNFPGSVLINKTGGTLTLAAAWNVNTSGATFTVSAGTLDLAGFNLTVNNTLTANGTGQINLQGGETVTTGGNTLSTGTTVDYYGTGTYTSLSLGNTYYNLSFTGTGSFTPNSSVTVNGSFTLSSGTFVAPSNLTVSGNFSTSGGTFTAGSNTVTFTDSTKTTVISGTNTFYNVTSVTSGKHITFPASVTTTVSNTFTVRGSSSSSLVLRSSSTNTQWTLTVNGTINASYIDIEDSNVCLSTNAPITASSSTNSGNNSCWLFPGNSWYNSNWGYRLRVTINHTKVPADQTNFPVLITWTSNSQVAAHAQSSGNDILFTSSDGITVLNYEIENYNHTTGEIEVWVQIPTLSSTQDTIVYMYFGYAAATSHANPTGVWDSNYVGVWHSNDSGTTTLADSTSNAHNGTKQTSTRPNPVTGLIAGAQSYNSSTSDFVNINNTASSIATGNFTVSGWVKPTNNFGVGSASQMISVLASSTSNNSVWLGFDGNTGIGTNTGKIFFGICADNTCSSLVRASTTETSWTAGTWYYVSATYSSTNGMNLYINGSTDGSNSTKTRGSTTQSTTFDIGADYNGDYLNGTLDEVRVSNIERSATWIQTEYNNQSSPSTFITTWPVTQPPSVQINGGVKFIGGSKLKAQ